MHACYLSICTSWARIFLLASSVGGMQHTPLTTYLPTTGSKARRTLMHSIIWLSSQSRTSSSMNKPCWWWWRRRTAAWRQQGHQRVEKLVRMGFIQPRIQGARGRHGRGCLIKNKTSQARVIESQNVSNDERASVFVGKSWSPKGRHAVVDVVVCPDEKSDYVRNGHIRGFRVLFFNLLWSSGGQFLGFGLWFRLVCLLWKTKEILNLL